MKDCVRARACEVGGWGGGVCVLKGNTNSELNQVQGP